MSKPSSKGGRATTSSERMAFQDVMRQRFKQVVEDATGRKAIGFMSGNQQNPDMICEIFVLSDNPLLRP